MNFIWLTPGQVGRMGEVLLLQDDTAHPEGEKEEQRALLCLDDVTQ